MPGEALTKVRMLRLSEDTDAFYAKLAALFQTEEVTPALLTLAAAKARGQRLGRPRATPDDVVARVVALSADLSPQKVAHQLTAEAIPTTRGAACWSASTVRRLLRGVELDTYAAAASCEGDGSHD